MLQMTKILGIPAAFGALLLLGQLALAAPTAPPAHAGGPVERFTAVLQLTADQQTKARAIFTASEQQVEQVLTPEQLAALKAQRAKTVGEIESVITLTADQKTKIAALRADAKTKATAIEADTTLTKVAKRTQLSELFRATHEQVLQVLTDDQRAQLRKAAETARQGQKGLRALNLTADQLAKIKAIRQQAMQDFRALLTPEQLQKLDQLHRGGPRQGKGAR